MLIKVMYKNGTYGMVKPYLLDKLLENDEIAEFMRSDKWVAATHDPIRCTSKPWDYDGPERRKSQYSQVLSIRELTSRSISDVIWIFGIFILIFIMFTRLQ